MKLQVKREALEKLNRQTNEMAGTLCQNLPVNEGFGTALAQFANVSVNYLLSSIGISTTSAA